MLVFSLTAMAQRRLPFQKSLQATVNGVDDPDGFPSHGYSINLSLLSYTINGNQWRYGIEYLQKKYDYKDIRIPAAQFTIEGGQYFKFLTNKRKGFVLNLGVSGMIGYESVNWDKKVLFDGATLQHGDNFIYGGAVSLESELFFSDWLAFIIQIRERILFGTEIGRFRTQAGLGFRVLIN